MLLLQRHTILFVLCIVLSSATAARKANRPFKPPKLFPRTNVTPSPQPTQQVTDNVADESFGQSPAFSPTPPKIHNDIEVPKPLVTLQQHQQQQQQTLGSSGSDTAALLTDSDALGLSNAEDKTENPTTVLDGEIDEDCDPDLIAFELITG